MAQIQEVWIFHGANAKFASAVFHDKDEAVKWIERCGMTGVLTKYPVGISVHEWLLRTIFWDATGGRASKSESNFGNTPKGWD